MTPYRIFPDPADLTVEGVANHKRINTVDELPDFRKQK